MAVKPGLHGILAVALCGAVTAGAAPASSDFAYFADALSDADYGERADFARVALEEVIASYEAVAEDAAGPGRSIGGKTDLRRWRAAARDFVNQLRDVRWRLDRGADVQLNFGADGVLVMFIDRQPVLLSGPNAAASGLLQHTVMAQYCGLHDCATGPAAAAAFSRLPTLRDAHAADAHWTFAQNRRPSFVTEEGFRFVFMSISDRAAKERLSRQLSSELRQLARALRTAAQSGRGLDWQQLRLLPRRNGSLEQVVFDDRGERFSLSLPLLARTPALWRETLPWLRAQAEGQDLPLTVRQAYLLVQPDSSVLYGASR